MGVPHLADIRDAIHDKVDCRDLDQRQSGEWLRLTDLFDAMATSRCGATTINRWLKLEPAPALVAAEARGH